MIYGTVREHTVPTSVCESLREILVDLGLRLYPEDRASDWLWNASYLTGFPGDLELEVRPYDWTWDREEVPPPNISFRGVRIWVYKYLGRGTTTDANLTHAEWLTWLKALREYTESVS